MADRNVFASALSHRNPQTMAARAGLSLPAIAFPVLALGFVILAAVVGPNVAAPASPLSGVLSAAMIAIMLGAVFAAVEFADVIAHRVGEPYGTVSRASAGELFGVNTIDSISATSITVTARVSTSVREPAPSRAGISGFGREPVYQCSRRALCPNVDLAELHLNNCRPLLFNGPALVR
jgi:hypothetical protein